MSKKPGETTENEPRTRALPVRQHDSRGKFLPGNTAAVGHGRPPARRNKMDLLRMLRDTADPELVAQGFATIWKKFARGDRWVVELVFAYFVGRPLQRSVSARGDLVDLLKSWRQDALSLSDNATDVALPTSPDDSPSSPVDITPDYVEHKADKST